MINKKLLIIVTAVFFCIFTGACSYVSVNEDRDNAQIVAEVNGTPITKQQYKETAAVILGNFGMTADEIEEADDPQMYKEYIINQLVDEELMYQKALNDGLVDTSDEHMQDIIKEKSDQADSLYPLFLSQAQSEGVSNPEKVASGEWNEYLRQSGYDDLEAMARKQIRDTAISDVYQNVISDVTATEQDAKDYYDMQVDLQKDLIESDPSNYTFYKSANQAYVNPAGSRYVKNLLIQIPEEAQSEIYSLRMAGDDESADKVRDEALKEIETQAKAALERIKNGEDFDKVMEEIGEDTGMQVEPGKTYGYLVVDGGQDYVSEFQDAAMSLNSPGEITDLIATDYGYHIIEYVKDGAGPVDFEIVKDDIIATRTSSQQSDALTQFITDLRDNAEVKIYMDRV